MEDQYLLWANTSAPSIYYEGRMGSELGEEDTMKVTYDSEVDVLRIILSEAAIEESDEDKAGIILDYDKEGNVVGLEVLDASTRMENPRSIEYAVMA